VTEVRWTEQAADDLAAIKEFIARDSPAHARGVAERLYFSVDQLRAFPESGRAVPEQPKYRELVRTPYRIVYRYAGDLVEIRCASFLTCRFPSTRTFASNRISRPTRLALFSPRPQ
jgi:plasmid stabilization system protein ParE